MTAKRSIEKAYRLARERYAEYNVNAETALRKLSHIAISLNAWQGDDVIGFENLTGQLSADIAATGNYPGRARTADELRSDLDKAISMIPCKPRVNLHAFHVEPGSKRIDRNEYGPRLFSNWASWAKERKYGLDFNGSFFNHPMASSGFTLSSRKRNIRNFWIEHAIASRHIGAYFGKKLQTACITNIWIPDGFKDTPVDRKTPREILTESLDTIFTEHISPAYNLDSLEGKLFGIGTESYVVGSHEFYLAYAVAKNKLLCMDTGHYHPTESVADKISAVLCQLNQIMLHVSRGVRWDSDHTVILTDEIKSLAEEIVRGGYLDRVHFGLDFFDASINRVAAWVIGARSLLKALLLAFLQPKKILRQAEIRGDYTTRLSLLEESKTLPFSAVWDYYCYKRGVPPAHAWLHEIHAYEKEVLGKRKG